MDDIAVALQRKRSRAYPHYLGPILLAVGLVFLAIGGLTARDEIRLSLGGVGVDGVVVGRLVNRGSESDTYSIAYRFVVRDGRTVTATDQVSYATFARLSAGQQVQVTYLPDDPRVSRIGGPGLAFVISLGLLAFGVLFAPLGIGLVATAVRERRHPADTLLAGTTTAAGVHRFERPPVRVVVDLLGPLIGALLFLGVAVVLLANVESDPAFLIAAIGFGFFGLLMASSVPSMLRRGARSAILEVSPAGLWTPESGQLAWSEIREVRLEDTSQYTPPRGRVRSREARSGYERLGIVPIDPARAADAPGGVARGLVRVFAMISGVLGGRRGRSVHVPASAPFGVYEYELEVPLAAIVPLIAPHVPVLDAGGRSLSLEQPPSQLVAGTPSRSRDDVDTLPPLPERPVAFVRRDLLLPRALVGLVGPVLWVAFPVLFLVVWIGVGAGRAPLPFLLLPLAVVLPFVVMGIGPVFDGLASVGIARGPETVLEVGPDGIAIQGSPPIRWRAIAAIRLAGIDLGESPDRPRLDIVPVDPAIVLSRPWAERASDAARRRLRAMKPWGDRTPIPPAISLDLGVLDADPDEVIDLIDRFRRVELER